jgi:hypothetical protein
VGGIRKRQTHPNLEAQMTGYVLLGMLAVWIFRAIFREMRRRSEEQQVVGKPLKYNFNGTISVSPKKGWKL